MVARLELTLNEKKTSIRNARQERFDFVGYTSGPHINPQVAGCPKWAIAAVRRLATLVLPATQGPGLRHHLASARDRFIRI